ncbi:hypothetical protein [Nocardioides insulae]|uniref:hypothetical protein n=1 Tax=Nocardioides insulae TaxID=394734 RepID=UPI00040CD47A|nr:hypothetical protein [Nocardioides insulae]
MAKALVGYLPSDIRNPHLLVVENSRLRARVQELQDLILQLEEEKDVLLARHPDTLEGHPDLEHGLDADLDREIQQEMQPV